MSNQTANHGEGNPEAAECFNNAEREFVESQAPQVGVDQEAELATELGRARSKGDDSTCLDGL
jgi:hypothetical protein